MNVISMSLWGDDDLYLQGALENARLAKEIYPGWTMRVYCAADVSVIEELRALDVDVRVVPPASDHAGLFWRLLPVAEEGLDYVIVRDADSRLNVREKAAVDAWIASGLPFHLMRDHFNHRDFFLMGMSGFRGGSIPDMADRIARFADHAAKHDDTNLLSGELWPFMRDRCLVHSSVPRPLGGEPFPPHPPFDGFVGEVIQATADERTEIALLMPSRGRPESALAAAQSARRAANSRPRLRIVVGVEPEDADSYRSAFGEHASWIHVLRDGGNYVRAVREMHAATRAGIYGLCADDFVFEAAGWDDRIRRAFDTLPQRVGLVHGDDGLQHSRIATAPFVSAEWIEAVGDILPGGYEHMYCDTEITEIARLAGVIRYLPKMRIIHRHYLVGAKFDATYERSSRTMRSGHEEFTRRRAERERIASSLLKPQIPPLADVLDQQLVEQRTRAGTSGDEHGAERGLPSRAQELLMRAAFCRDARAVEAWAEWNARGGIQTADPASTRLFPLLWWNLQKSGVNEVELEKLKPHYLVSWAKSHERGELAVEMIGLFERSGISTMLLKGIALAARHYEKPALRPMSDVDLMVPAGDAEKARGMLLARGWRPTQTLPETALSLLHGLGFEDRKGRLLDLHWHSLHESLVPAADNGFWSRAEWIEIDGTKARILSPADQLLHVCVHGLRWARVPAIQWVPDVMAVLHSSGSRIDWDVLVREAQGRRVVMQMRRALEYVRTTFGVMELDDVCARLAAVTCTIGDRLDFAVRVRPPSLGRDLLMYWLDHCRLHTGPSRYLGFPSYLSSMWGLRSLAEVPATAARKAAERLGGARGRA
jgi:hypothetical protein